MTPIELHILRTLLERMDVPNMRLDLTKHSNVRWLLRNLCADNSEAEGIDEVMLALKTLARTQR